MARGKNSKYFLKKKERGDFTFKNAKGVEYRVIFRKPNSRYFGEDCDGTCSPPDSKLPTILINPHNTEQTQLNTAIHEFAHAFFWHSKEYEIKKFADALSRFLYNYNRWRKLRE